MLNKKLITLDAPDHIQDLQYFVVEVSKCQMRTHPTATPDLMMVEIYDIPNESALKELGQYIMSMATKPNAGYWEVSTLSPKPEMKPCPFCGSKRLAEPYARSGAGFFVSCVTCGAEGPKVRASGRVEGTRDLALRNSIELWNAGWE